MSSHSQQIRQYYQHSHYQQAIQFGLSLVSQSSADVDTLRYLAQSYYRLKQLDEAMVHIQSALKRAPEDTACHFVIANIYKDQNKTELAVQSLKKAIEYDKAFYNAYCNLGHLIEEQSPEQAEQYLLKALALKPERTLAYVNLTSFYGHQLDFDKAMKYGRIAIQKPNAPPDAFLNYGFALGALGQFDMQKQVFEAGLRQFPREPRLTTYYGHLLLRSGQFQKGWLLMGARFIMQHQAAHFTPTGDTPVLSNSDDIKGRKVWLRPEQGYGDCIQFVRYAQFLKSQGAQVALEIYEPLVKLLEKQPYIDECVQWPKKPQHVDYHLPLLGFGQYYKIDTHSPPVTFPYIRSVQDVLPKALADSIDASSKPRIGFFWRGSKTHVHDAQRSTAFANWQDLLEVDSVCWFSLQRDCTHEDEVMLKNFSVVDCQSGLQDFSSAAAIINKLDLVIGVDSAYLHLAGAMNKPCWNLLALSPDWRWLTDMDTTHWYPGMRLFRQQSPLKWDDVFREVKAALITKYD